MQGSFVPNFIEIGPLVKNFIFWGGGGGSPPQKFFRRTILWSNSELHAKFHRPTSKRKYSKRGEKNCQIRKKIRGRNFSGLENGQVQTAVTFFLDGISGRGKIPLRAVT